MKERIMEMHYYIHDIPVCFLNPHIAWIQTVPETLVLYCILDLYLEYFWIGKEFRLLYTVRSLTYEK